MKSNEEWQIWGTQIFKETKETWEVSEGNSENVNDPENLRNPQRAVKALVECIRVRELGKPTKNGRCQGSQITFGNWRIGGPHKERTRSPWKLWESEISGSEREPIKEFEECLAIIKCAIYSDNVGESQNTRNLQETFKESWIRLGIEKLKESTKNKWETRKFFGNARYSGNIKKKTENLEIQWETSKELVERLEIKELENQQGKAEGPRERLGISKLGILINNGKTRGMLQDRRNPN